MRDPHVSLVMAVVDWFVAIIDWGLTRWRLWRRR